MLYIIDYLFAGHISNDDHPKPLRLALQDKENFLHGKVSGSLKIWTFFEKYEMYCWDNPSHLLLGMIYLRTPKLGD